MINSQFSDDPDKKMMHTPYYYRKYDKFSNVT